jgi:DNA replication protein DnaC
MTVISAKAVAQKLLAASENPLVDEDPLIGKTVHSKFAISASSCGKPRCLSCDDMGQVIRFRVIEKLSVVPSRGGVQWTTIQNAIYRIDGYGVVTCPACNGEHSPSFVQEELALNKIRAEAQREKQKQESGLLPSELERTLDSLIERGAGSAAVKTAALDLMHGQFGMLTWWGGAGNGKTVALQAMVNETLRRGEAARYRTLSDLIEELRDGYAGGKFEKTARFREFVACRLLAIDEIDKVAWTEWAKEVFFALLDERYRYGMENGTTRRYTALAMNLSPETLPEYVYSRLSWRKDYPDEAGFRIVKNMDPDGRNEFYG